MKRLCLALVAVLVAGGATLLGVAEPAVADTTVALPTTSFHRIAAANGYVFVAGTDGDGILVRNADGSARTTIAEPDPQDLATSPDGTRLYVALGSWGKVAAIDTTTLTEVVRYTTGPCTDSVTATDATVWFGYGCSFPDASIGSIDLTQTPAVVGLGAATGFLNSPIVTSSPATPGTLFAADLGESPSTVRSYSVSGTSLTAGPTREVGSNLADMAITSDGQDLVTASGSPYNHPRFKTSDLSPDRQYTTTYYPNSVATTTNDVVAAGVDFGDPSISVYDGNITRLHTYNLTDELAPRGLVFGTDSRTLYAVSVAGTTVTLHVLRDAAVPSSTVSLSGPKTAKRAAALTVTGALTSLSSPITDSVLSVHKSDLDGTHTLAAVHTDALGNFAIHDKPGVGGTNTYTVTFAGDATSGGTSKSIKVVVSRSTAALTAKPSHSMYSYGQHELVTVHLGTTYKLRKVSIYGKPVGGTQKLLRTATVNGSGNVSASAQYVRNFHFIVKFAGDERYAPRTVTSSLVKVRAKVDTAIAGQFGKSGKYHLFHQSSGGGFAIGVLPNKSGERVRFVLQRQTNGRWRTVSTYNGYLDSDSVLGAGFDGLTFTPYRLHGEYHGDTFNAASNSVWVYVQFR